MMVPSGKPRDGRPHAAARPRARRVASLSCRVHVAVTAVKTAAGRRRLLGVAVGRGNRRRRNQFRDSRGSRGCARSASMRLARSWARVLVRRGIIRPRLDSTPAAVARALTGAVGVQGGKQQAATRKSGVGLPTRSSPYHGAIGSLLIEPAAKRLEQVMAPLREKHSSFRSSHDTETQARRT
jgi:hypothetical protein